MVTDLSQKMPIFECKFCDYNTCNKKDYNKHLLTIKHKKRISAKNHGLQVTESPQKSHYQCDACFKIYSSRNGLWLHKKKCENYKEDSPEEYSNDVIIELLKQNQEFKDLIIDQNKQIVELAGKVGNTINNTTNNTTNHTTNNNNNFNLQFFLNEQCKDALNIMEFISQLQIKLTDLDMVGRVGYSEGISKIFIRGLKELDVFKRPVHCSDLKRETLYVKDQNSWEKDNDDKKKMKTAIKYIAAKNFKQINDWQEENPESENTETQKHMEYQYILLNSMGGATDEEDEKIYNKIIKNVAKEVIIDKTNPTL
jgi:hypothetical protein